MDRSIVAPGWALELAPARNSARSDGVANTDRSAPDHDNARGNVMGMINRSSGHEPLVPARAPCVAVATRTPPGVAAKRFPLASQRLCAMFFA